MIEFVVPHTDMSNPLGFDWPSLKWNQIVGHEWRLAKNTVGESEGVKAEKEYCSCQVMDAATELQGLREYKAERERSDRERGCRVV